MADIIQLLPDAIANQIAAGEVIQRPASVVKELMENAIDAGASEVNVIVKDAGKTLIQVIDNGSGMSETDARLSFERHATSKIRAASDLFSIKTKGFRGEALASIAAIAHVEMLTKLHDEDLGSRLMLEGSKVTKQEFCQAADGTKISVKNLFFNVPARRKFLKTDSVELKHLTDEFIRIVLAHKSVKFTLHHNEREMYHLPSGKFMQRISGIYGRKFAEKMIPVSEETEIVKIGGYIGKPESARRSRSHQFLFVNQRFIKSHYLNHAIKLSYENIIPEDVQAVYFIFLEIDPERIDVNIHPTKQEIKFEEERLIYNYLRVAVKQALGKYSVTPLLDFEKETDTDRVFSGAPESSYSGGDPLFQGNRPKGGDRDEWQQIFEGINQLDVPDSDQPSSNRELFDLASSISGEAGENPESVEAEGGNVASGPFQLHKSYILSQIKSGLLIIDQQHAHERILYEYYLKLLEGQKAHSQQELFPQTFELNPEKSELLSKILLELEQLGFQIEHFGQNTFVVKGIPSTLREEINTEELIHRLIDSYSSNIEFHLGINENLARSFAVSSSLKRNSKLTDEEMRQLIDELFACENPYTNPVGKKCFITYDLDILHRSFSGQQKS